MALDCCTTQWASGAGADVATLAELAASAPTGFVCGPADHRIFNKLFNCMSADLCTLDSRTVLATGLAQGTIS